MIIFQFGVYLLLMKSKGLKCISEKGRMQQSQVGIPFNKFKLIVYFKPV